MTREEFIAKLRAAGYVEVHPADPKPDHGCPVERSPVYALDFVTRGYVRLVRVERDGAVLDNTIFGDFDRMAETIDLVPRGTALLCNAEELLNAR